MNGWEWGYEGYDPAGERLREALLTLGNGCFATRGALPECRADDVHYPGTYAAGCYNRLTSTVAGRSVENEDLVNLPDWLPLRVRFTEPAPSPWLSPDRHEPLAHRVRLDLRSGILERISRFEVEGRRFTVRQLRLVHMARPHLALLRTGLTAENWSGAIEVESAIDGRVANAGVERYRQLAGRHLTDVRTGEREPDLIRLSCRTSDSGTGIAVAARTTADARADGVRSRLAHRGARVAHVWRLPLEAGRTVTVDKVVAVHTTLDRAISGPVTAAVDEALHAPDPESLIEEHRNAWARLWDATRLEVPGEAGRVLRLHLFHVLQTLSPHTADLDAGVPARGLHGEAYRGHVFWDELFVLPYLNLHFPEVSRALLTYRHRRLERACRNAREAGYSGASYPWQSGSDGREETQEIHLNPRSGRWLPDHSRLQHHVGSAVAYNVVRYGEATGDTAFLHGPGAEMLVRIAQFWSGRAVYDTGPGRYRVTGVVGPDEYHDAYPDGGRPGIDDNAYTNVTAAWVLGRALAALRSLPVPLRRDLLERSGVTSGETDRWEEVAHGLYVPFHSGVISQFEGYGDLAELDWEAYRDRYGDIRRLDRILEAEGDSVNRYQASKQADVLMLGFLFPPAELAALFRQLGHRLDDELWQRTVDYYLRRTSHGSTLSSLVHAWVLARARRADAWAFAREALAGDVADLQGGTTGEGIHLGAMAGTLDLVQRCLTGLEPRDGVLRLDPVPVPTDPAAYGFALRYQGHWGIRLRFEGERLSVTVPRSDRAPVRVELPGGVLVVSPGETRTADWSGG
ncbi:glycoside hydrolase family 65 protein [Streptomyces sp. NPDC051018]|uniref:glycoside hydrolase family 65 protein n=1 Tax=Streptomyces sp. NPDC051018 TaxID=3365639 RepID=UPI0037A7301A